MSNTAPRIALIHALAHSVAPINEAMHQQWPQAVRMNLLDDSLSADLAAQSAGLNDAMTQRFLDLASYAVATGAHAVLFTCSAFGPCIEAVARAHPTVPVLKPNEAMVAEALAVQQGNPAPVGLIASFAPTLASMPSEFGAGASLQTALVEPALVALNEGRLGDHDAAVLAAAKELVAKGCGVIALAQFSMARAASLLRRELHVPVLTTPDSAIRRLQLRLQGS
tara:strand:+ start:502 stop:1173 length:672 start_codon:yes stop_codon:yes gene_type:complete